MTTDGTLKAELILYRTSDDAVHVAVLYQSEVSWLDQRHPAELFGVEVRTVTEHLRNVYDSGELNEEATFRKFRMVRSEGSRGAARGTVFYNLDAIIYDDVKWLEPKRSRKRQEQQ